MQAFLPYAVGNSLLHVVMVDLLVEDLSVSSIEARVYYLRDDCACVL